MNDHETAYPHPGGAFPAGQYQKQTTRRAALSFGLLAAAGLATGCSQHTYPEKRKLPVPPSSTINSIPSISWPTQLKSLKPADGVIKTFKDVFVMTSISQVATMTTKTGSTRLAICMRGNSNQVQLMDPIAGVREKVITLPGHLIARGMAWDPIGRTLYIGTTDGHIYAYAYDTSKIADIGRAAPKASSLYGLTVDSTGRLWGGSYPLGIIWNYTPKTKKFATLPRIDKGTEYIYSLAITADDTVYVGTGTNSPKVVCFPAASPTKRTVLKLPALPDTGFVNNITVAGDHVLITASTVKTHLIWNHRTQTATTAALRMAQGQSASTAKSASNYWLNEGVLHSTNSTTGDDSRIGILGVQTPEHIWAENDIVYVLSRNGASAITHRFNLETKTSTVQSAASLMPAGVEVHSLLAHSNGNIYIGGFLGEGISTLAPDTGERWQSPDNVAPNQISGMIEWDATRTYIGSYGAADIIRLDTDRAAEGPIAFELLERLSHKYAQSRPIGWAKNSKRVFFGTVPDYGLSGGAMGIIDPGTETVEQVYNKLMPKHSIVGLTADENYVYGTTSTRNGMGIPDTPGDAKVFAFDLEKRKIAWRRRIPGHKGAMAPILVDDRILAGTLEGIVVLRASDGVLLRNHAFTNKFDKDQSPGWFTANLKRIGDSYRFVHRGADSIHVVDFLDGTVQKISVDGEVGTALAVTEDGRVFVSHDVVGIAEVSTDARDSAKVRVD